MPFRVFSSSYYRSLNNYPEYSVGFLIITLLIMQPQKGTTLEPMGTQDCISPFATLIERGILLFLNSYRTLNPLLSPIGTPNPKPHWSPFCNLSKSGEELEEPLHAPATWHKKGRALNKAVCLCLKGVRVFFFLYLGGPGGCFFLGCFGGDRGFGLDV